MTQGYIPSIGMEVHAELSTRSKMFCGCPVGFGGEPNTRICPVCTGQPGALPVPNRGAIEMVLRTALALNCTVPERSVFHRKNYFYPDLPKGYQISQYEETNPLGYSGYLELPADEGTKKVRIRRVHLEEDTGKLIHLPGGESGIDYNRSGVPLMEIVTEFPPDIHSAEEARDYLSELRLLLLYLGVCDGKIEEGSLRGEPNISVAPEGSATLGVKTEIKNLGSIKAVYLGVKSEVARQIEAMRRGETLRQETRGWNEERESTYVMRVKEEENDYRYFPDPDLPPMRIAREWLESLRAELPELPAAKRARYRRELGLPAKDADQLVADPATAAYFEQCVQAGCDAKRACNWLTGELTRLMKESDVQIANLKVRPEHLRELQDLVEAGTLSSTMAKDVLAACFADGRSPRAIVAERGDAQVSDSEELLRWCRAALEANPSEVAKYRAGHRNVIGFFVGHVMRSSGGKANPKMVQEILREELERE
ncbi:MAG: Asp-tRNA(Asn)/Glu-tRNA(Gln) amidotransferase subunit GatB [Fimbriimonadia bacterium]|jgi:aspartyl-tRNA(Asn)/glutamyl-tRNA(Gln) amidotransferase subunit B